MRRQGHKNRLDQHQEVGIEPFEFCIREHDPVGTQVDVRLLRFGENCEHVDMPLSKFMNPVWDLVKCLSIHDDIIEPFLKERNQ